MRTAGPRALFALVFAFPIVTLAAVGRTPTSWDVSDTGQANYSIPIFTPPGTHGMTPRLALVYGHQSNDTLLGVGWGISGLSAISRCEQTWAQDGTRRDVRNDYSDKFCLDGNRLRLIGTGPYGANGAEYRTELETFARIYSYGTAGNGPQYFTVETKDGLKYEYGNTADSRIESVGQTTARTWAVTKVSDRAGNAILFTYSEDATNGAFRISSIQYTSNTPQSLTPAYTVSFIYESKLTNEIDSGYLAGSVIREITRLDRVDVLYNTTNLVRRYELTYEGALSSTSRSRLASVQECAGASGTDCLPATTFSYQNGTQGLTSEANSGNSVPASTTPWPLDVNGDGRDDLVYSSTATSGTGHWWVMLANSSGGYNAAQSTGVVNYNYGGAIPIDYNADGLEDLLVPYSGGTWWVMLGSASGVGLGSPTDTGTPAPSTGTGLNARAMDVNGDGLQDLVYAELYGSGGGDAIRYRLKVAGGAFGSVSTLAGPMPTNYSINSMVFFPWGQRSPYRSPDFNGDGRGDLLYRLLYQEWDPETHQWLFTRTLEVVTFSGWGFSQLVSNFASPPYYADLNGDGKADILYVQGSNWRYRFSRGTSFTSESTGPSTTGYSTELVVLDWDSDGYDDLLVPNTSSGTWHVFRSTGIGIASAVNTGIPSSSIPTIADINGDGLHDLAYITSGTWRSRLHAGNFPDLLTTATDGHGNYATFAYAPLSTYSLYYRYASATYPMQEYQGPLHVVSTVTASNGIGGTYNLQSFYYEAARFDLQGRGFLGFGYRSWIDSRDGTAQRRSYRQDFPYIGAVTNARRTQE